MHTRPSIEAVATCVCRSCVGGSWARMLGGRGGGGGGDIETLVIEAE